MSGIDPHVPSMPTQGSETDGQSNAQQAQSSEDRSFRNQFEDISQPQIVGQYAHQQAFDMASVAGALPQNALNSATMTSRPHYGHQDMPPMVTPGSYQTNQQYYSRPVVYDPASLARAHVAQQQQYVNMHYGQHSMMQNPGRLPNYSMPPQMPYGSVDPYAFAMNAAQYAPLDPRFAPPSSFGLPAAMPPDHGQFARRSSTDTGPVPSFPRGPPRKPKQSGHALWVGNLPPAATVIELKDHFSREATSDIESVFLISKSNCAFVNYRSEEACASAMNRFHDSRFHGVRLVCRLRRGSASTGPSALAVEGVAESPVVQQSAVTTPESRDASHSPDVVRSQSSEASSPISRVAASPEKGPPPPSPDAKVPEKFFIVKSLTAQDLEASVRNKTWATQSHNEEALNRAYEQADTVYLIFSANKSGEYFGYAKMTSPIAGEPVNLSTLSARAQEESAQELTGAPQSIPTEATATAPRGRIIDDSARGTIFWEADHDDQQERPLDKEEDNTSSDGQNWGRQFSIEWMSTTRLPFYRTRGLRNPWNSNREVKIARDGTELEPSVARRLIQMFHRAPPNPSVAGPSGSAASQR